MSHHPQGNTCTVTGLLSNSVGPSNITASHPTCTHDPAVSPGSGDRLWRGGGQGQEGFQEARKGPAVLCDLHRGRQAFSAKVHILDFTAHKVATATT